VPAARASPDRGFFDKRRSSDRSRVKRIRVAIIRMTDYVIRSASRACVVLSLIGHAIPVWLGVFFSVYFEYHFSCACRALSESVHAPQILTRPSLRGGPGNGGFKTLFFGPPPFGVFGGCPLAPPPSSGERFLGITTVKRLGLPLPLSPECHCDPGRRNTQCRNPARCITLPLSRLGTTCWSCWHAKKRHRLFLHAAFKCLAPGRPEPHRTTLAHFTHEH